MSLNHDLSRWGGGVTCLLGLRSLAILFHLSVADKCPGDELSMHIATLTVLHRLVTFDKSLSLTVWSGLISIVLMAAFITWHCMTDELIGHSILFGITSFGSPFPNSQLKSPRRSHDRSGGDQDPPHNQPSRARQSRSKRSKKTGHLGFCALRLWLRSVEHRSDHLRQAHDYQACYWHALVFCVRVAWLVAYLYWNGRLHL